MVILTILFGPLIVATSILITLIHHHRRKR